MYDTNTQKRFVRSFCYHFCLAKRETYSGEQLLPYYLYRLSNILLGTYTTLFSAMYLLYALFLRVFNIY